MALPTTVTLDSYNLASLGFVLGDPNDALGGPEFRHNAIAMPLRDGLAITDDGPDVGERTFTLSGFLMGSTPAVLRTNYRSLQYRAGGGDCVIVLADDTTRRITARLKRLRYNYLGVKLNVGSSEAWASVEMEWVAHENPFWEDVTATTVNISTSAAACATGTWRVWPVVTITAPSGSVVNPIVILKDDGGTEIARLTLTHTILTGDSVVIDMAQRKITKIVSAVSTVSAALRTGGKYFALDPYQGTNNYLTSDWPQLQLAVTSGTPGGTAVYRKRYQA